MRLTRNQILLERRRNKKLRRLLREIIQYGKMKDPVVIVVEWEGFVVGSSVLQRHERYKKKMSLTSLFYFYNQS